MTSSTRLTKELRAHLNDLARKRVHDTDAEAAYRKASDVAEKTLLRLIKAQYPPKEMKVLMKYGCAMQTHRFNLMIVAQEPRFFDWKFDVDAKDVGKLPLQPRSPYGTMRIRIEAEADIAVMNACLSAEAHHEKMRESKLETFRAVIDNARYLEQVEECWPAAREVRQYIKTLPVVRLAPLMDQVREIVAAKQA